MPDINAAYQWAIDTCNASNPWAGYSMDNREQVQIGNIVYYDCSSFIWYALVQGGGFPLSSPPFATPSMYSVLNSAGFQIIVPDNTTQTLSGDILWYDHGGGVNGHTEMVFAGGVGEARTMGAHSSHLPIADQVSINSGYVSLVQRGWQFLARWGAGVEYHWHNKNIGGWSRNDVEAQENVLKMMQILGAKGWTINAVAALAGNQFAESGFNPWRWESDTVDISRGYGLFQYTPASKYINSPTAQGYTDFAPNYPMGSGGQDDGTAQLEFMDNNVDGGYIQTSAYPISFADFKTSTLSPSYLALAWLYNYERPLDPSATSAQRAAEAAWWYDWITAHPWISSGGSFIGLKRAHLLHRKRRLGY